MARGLGLARSIVLVALTWLLFLCRTTNAGEVYGASEILPRELVFDRSPPPPLPRMQQLERRQDDSSSISLPAITTVTVNPSSGAATQTSSSALETATNPAATDLPKPFDTSLGNNFTSSTCPAFFQSFLNDQTFNDCLPFSLLLETSNGFFRASQSLLSLTQTLQASCNVDYTQCSSLMSTLAQQIRQQSNCGADLQLLNPMVEQAYNGFLAYPTLYHAGCLVSNATSNYCFADAVTNASAPTSSYVYYLPLGNQLPGGSQPTCNKCLQDTMAVFAQSAGNSTLPLSGDYEGAAQQIDMNCGPGFVETSVVRTSGAATTRTAIDTAMSSWTGLVVLLAVATSILT